MRRYSIELIEYMNFFEKATKVRAKDCFLNDELCFIVDAGQSRRAVGQGGANIGRLCRRFNRKIRIVEFSPKPCNFILNLLRPLRVKNIREDGKKVIITADNTQEKGKIFGRDKQNIKRVQDIASKYFDVIVAVE